MRTLLLVCVLVSITSTAFAVTPEEIVRLVKLKTSDDVLIQILTTSPLDQPLSPSEIITLKQNGVSERLLTILLNGVRLQRDTLPAQEGESVWVDESARYYYTTSVEGEKRIVLTNLDENGNRMGPPPPPKPEPAPQNYPEQPAYAVSEPVQYTSDYRTQFVTSPRSNVSNDYPSSSPAPGYYSPYFVSDYPGSAFGFHLLPQFTVIYPGFFGHKTFPHCSTPPAPRPHSHGFRSFR